MRNASVSEALEAVQRGETLIDVRTQPEYVAGHAAGALFLPMVSVPMRIAELDPARPVFVVCESGGRSFQVCQYLERYGIDAVNVLGGMAQWRALNMDMEMGE